MIFTKFFLGVSDHVLCFSCDGGLKNWEPNDDPWTEHETWFGQCPYLNLMKNESPETGSTRPETAVAVTVQNPQQKKRYNTGMKQCQKEEQ